jgi:hypothetical protein
VHKKCPRKWYKIIPLSKALCVKRNRLKTLSEKINWYRESETRQWKRIWHCIEISLISISAIAILVVIQIYGNGTKLQPVFMLFTLAMAISSAALVIPIYQSVVFKRWHVQFITLGLGCGVGISAIAAFLILELQLGNT